MGSLTGDLEICVRSFIRTTLHLDRPMNNDNTNNLDHDQTEQEAGTCEVSDDALEAASAASARGNPTLFQTTYCFGCPS